jgi:hypothetical protein
MILVNDTKSDTETMQTSNSCFFLTYFFFGFWNQYIVLKSMRLTDFYMFLTFGFCFRGDVNNLSSFGHGVTQVIFGLPSIGRAE